MKPLLTAEQVSQWLSLSLSKVYQMADAGTLPSRKIDGSIRFIEEELLAYLDGCRREREERTPRPRRKKLNHINL